MIGAYLLRFQPPALPEPVVVGRPRTLACENRCCRDRTAPVFLVLGVRGLAMICADCRARQNRLVRATLATVRRREP
jgi:hypothetical protein